MTELRSVLLLSEGSVSTHKQRQEQHQRRLMGNGVHTDRLKVGKDSPPGLKLSYWFWMELGRPTQFRNAKTFKAWSPRMESLLAKSGLDYERFKWFLVWVCRLRDSNGANYGNDFTAQNLRAANDPMSSLVKQFPKTYFEIFLPRADKRIPLLMEKREREDEQRAARQKPEPEKRVRFVDILVADASDGSIKNAQDLDRLDDAFHMLQPFPGESMEDWIDRECELLSGDDWRCEYCTYAFSIDGGDDARIKLCAGCEEECILWAQDDLEWMHDGEVGEEWMPWDWGTVPLGYGAMRYPQYGYQRAEMLPVVLAPRKKCSLHTGPCMCPRAAPEG